MNEQTDPLVNINELRRRILAGGEVDPEELAAAFRLLREARGIATTEAAEKKAARANAKGAKVAKAPLDLMSIFGGGDA